MRGFAAGRSRGEADGRWRPRLVPAELALADEPAPGDGRVRRSTRDWVVDSVMVLIAAGLGLLGLVDVSDPGVDPTAAEVAFVVVTGVAACMALWLRRRWPVGVALATCLAATLLPQATGASLIALFSAAIHRPTRVALALAALNLATISVYYAIYANDLEYWINLLVGAAVCAAVVGWGTFVRARRQLVLSLGQRARQAESERDLRVAQAREQERTRIAREMHDVLAHRISLLSLHAGALEVGADASPEQLSKTAAIVRASAHQALEDLRDVISVLRSEPGVDGAAVERPQPGLGDVADLIAEAREAGARVRLETELATPDTVPEAIGRTAFRVIQEGLTNSRKHAPDAAVAVRIAGAPGDGLELELLSLRRLDRLAESAIPGSGTGLVGLAERVALADGRLEFGRTGTGDFRLHAWLPWSA